MSAGAAPSPAPAGASARRAQVEQVLGEILKLAQWPARLETRDAADGGIAVAVHFEGQGPPHDGGANGHPVEALQFLVNKVVNRPGQERRWVSLGVGGFPEPRPSAPPQASAPKPPAQRTAPSSPRASAPLRPEAQATVEVSPEWEALGALLRAKALRHGRRYAVALLGGPERAQLAKAAAGEGLAVKVEGEGHFKRVAVLPDKVTAMPRKLQFPDDDEADDEG